jgi:L-iditol 2-dehydrogenase
VKIPARNSFAEGALLEPVNTVLKAVRRLSLLRGDVVLVAGQGPVGLMFTRLLQLAGMRVIATDLMAARLKLAKKFGAKWAMLAPNGTGRAELPLRHSNPGRAEHRRPALPLSAPKRGEGGRRPGEVFSTFIHRTTRGRGLDAAVIAVPSDAVVRQAQTWLRGGGQLMLFAHTKRGAVMEIDPATVCVDEKDLLGSYSSDFTLQDEVARLVFSRRLDVRPLITHRFPLAQTAAAIGLASQPTEDSLKIIVEGTACHRP